MFGLSGIRLGGAIAALLALIALVGSLVWFVRDHDRLQGVERRALACEAAVKNGEATATDVASSTLRLNCPQAISDAATRAARYLGCDAALAKADLYAVRTDCSAAVKRRDAQATALAADARDLARQLSETRGQLTGALTRAEARATTLQKRNRDAQAAIAGAPRAADGRIRCDDRCLRDLAGN